MPGSNVDRLEFPLKSHSFVIVLNELVEFVRVADVKLGEGENPLVNIYWMLVANGRRFKEIIGVLFGFSLRNVFLDIFIKAHCFVEVYGL